MSEFSDEERVRLVMREMLAVDPGSEAFPDPSDIRKVGGWRWRQRIDPKVVVAVAAIVILVATLVLVGPLRPGPNKQRVTVSNPPVTTSPSATSVTSTSAPVVAASTRCQTSELKLSTGPPVPEKTQQGSVLLTITNFGSVPCYLHGYPGITLHDAAGQLLPLSYQRKGDLEVTSATPQQVNLAVGATGYVLINKSVCAGQEAASASTLRFIPPDDTASTTMDLLRGLTSCETASDPGSVLDISPVEPTEGATFASSGKAPPSTSTATTLVLHAAPATNLKDGEVVQVNVSGFPPGKVFLSECGAAADANALGCGAQLAAQPFVVIENGAGTASFTVTHQAASTPLSPQPSTTCTNQCVLVATSGVPPSGARHIQTVTLAFGP